MRETNTRTDVKVRIGGYTRPGGRELAGRKIIRCPHCREMFMDVDRNTKVELFSIPERKRKPPNCEKIKHCSVCGGKVGYNLMLPTGT